MPKCLKTESLSPNWPGIAEYRPQGERGKEGKRAHASNTFLSSNVHVSGQETSTKHLRGAGNHSRHREHSLGRER